MEEIFWGQNPNEYPPVSAFPGGLVQWATPTNLGNVKDLMQYLKKLCEEKGQHLFTPTIVADDALLAAALQTCFQNVGFVYNTDQQGTPGSSGYVPPQDYTMGVLNLPGTALYSFGSSQGIGGISNPASTTAPPPNPACGNGILEPGEVCGEPGGWPSCWALCNTDTGQVTAYSCQNCVCALDPDLSEQMTPCNDGRGPGGSTN